MTEPEKKAPEKEAPTLKSEIEREASEIRESAAALLEADGKPSQYRLSLLKDIIKRTQALDILAGKLSHQVETFVKATATVEDAILLADFVKECIEKLKPELDLHMCSLRVFIEKDIMVKIDPNILRPILNELITNAIEHNPPMAWLKIEGHAVMEEIVMTVKDCGDGIPKENLAKIFLDAPSRKPKKENEKIFGLPEIKQMLQSYHQKIWVNSAVGKGTTFYFTLPAVPPPPEN